MHGQMREERLDLGGRHIFGVSLVVKQNVALDPSDVCFLGANRIVLAAYYITHALDLEASWGARSSPLSPLF